MDDLTNTINSAEAATYLGLTPIEFARYSMKDICYQLIKGRSTAV